MITKEMVEDSLTYKLTGGLMFAASILSDAQEMLNLGDHSHSNEAINDAKRIIFMVMDGKLNAGIRTEL